MNNHTHTQITHFTKELRLPTIRTAFEQAIIEAKQAQSSYETFLEKLLEQEYDTRLENRKRQRIRRAQFPAQKRLEQLDRAVLPAPAQERLPQLETLEFIEKGQNIVLAGNPGTGKTHIATGLGIKACQQGYKVLFTTVPRLITQIRESRSEKKLRSLENQFEKYDLVICDEFGYISFDKQASELLFTHLSLRAGRKATIITTNLAFDKWKDLFGDAVLAAAMVDRLTHKAHLINMNGPSFRVRETKEWRQK